MPIPPHAIEELAQRLYALLPPDHPAPREALLGQVRQLLMSGLTQLDLASRADFEVLRLTLLRTRERLEQLEYRLLALEEEAMPG